MGLVHDVCSVDVCGVAGWAGGWANAHKDQQSLSGSSWAQCYADPCRGQASCCPTKEALAHKLGYLDSSLISTIPLLLKEVVEGQQEHSGLCWNPWFSLLSSHHLPTEYLLCIMKRKN